ncbi:MAG: hypothetical protein APF76_05955 [Desulfitibacter sp. BRH_c19]|nr:MAG: hypothetical protein APF76_05955 [Desulfitibacter sp. BRH_c19]
MVSKRVALIIILIAASITTAACGNMLLAEVDSNTHSTEIQQVDRFDELVAVADELLKTGGIPVISSAEVYEKINLQPDPSYYVVDLRSTIDFMRGSILGAVSIPYETSWQQDQIDKLPMDKRLILICDDGTKSAQAAVQWKMMGYQVMIMENGMNAWNKADPHECAITDNPISSDETSASSNNQIPEVMYESELEFNEVLVKINEKIFQEELTGTMDPINLRNSIDNREDNFLVVDLRAREHYMLGHIPEAISIPFEEVVDGNNLEKLPMKKEIVLVDYYGSRSNQVARMLNQLGYNAVPMDGGMGGWTIEKEIIGTEPIDCQWGSCLSNDLNDNTIGGCSWKNLPTVVTRVQILDGGG